MWKFISLIVQEDGSFIEWLNKNLLKTAVLDCYFLVLHVV